MKLKRKIRRNKTGLAYRIKSDLIEEYNGKLYIEADDNPDIAYRKMLHPTKGYRKINKIRDIVIDTPLVARYKKVLNVLRRCQIQE